MKKLHVVVKLPLCTTRVACVLLVCTGISICGTQNNGVRASYDIPGGTSEVSLHEEADILPALCKEYENTFPDRVDYVDRVQHETPLSPVFDPLDPASCGQATPDPSELMSEALVDPKKRLLEMPPLADELRDEYDATPHKDPAEPHLLLPDTPTSHDLGDKKALHAWCHDWHPDAPDIPPVKGEVTLLRFPRNLEE